MSSRSQAAITILARDYEKQEVKDLIDLEYDDKDSWIDEEGDIVRFGCYSVKWGSFNLENKLVEMEIPFDRHTCADGEIEECTRTYRPATADYDVYDKEIFTADDESFVINSDLAELLDLPDNQLRPAIINLLKATGWYVISLEELAMKWRQEENAQQP